jgi:hypothetical protein
MNVTVAVTFYKKSPSTDSRLAAAPDRFERTRAADMDPLQFPQRYVPPRCNESAWA